MSNIQVAGRVQYMPGPWGRAVAAAGAQVEVIDVDTGGGDDVIWSGQTGPDGRFSGTSSNWQDDRTVSIWVPGLHPPPGHWESRSQPDPTDVLLLKLRVRVDGRTQEIFPFVNGASMPVVLPWGPAYVPKAARALLVLNNTVAAGDAKYRGLYQFLEASGDAVAHSVCGPHYQVVRSLNAGAATLSAYLDTLRELCRMPDIQAVDCILNMHGAPGHLFFADSVPTGQDAYGIGDKLVPLNLAGKLRLLYSTCCYGNSHAPDFLRGGFNTVIGGKQVVCNSASEYPVLLTNWVAGQSVEAALAPAQAVPLRQPMDSFARTRLGFTDADSFKLVSGNGALTIGSLAS